MSKLEVFDPPMCCPTGVCGPAVDPAVAQFAADMKWLASQGVAVERFSLSQQPGAFVENETVKHALDEGGSECLPLTLVDGRVVSRGQYARRAELTTFVEIAAEKPVSLYTAAVVRPKCC